jgi:hypothetical protein
VGPASVPSVRQRRRRFGRVSISTFLAPPIVESPAPPSTWQTATVRQCLTALAWTIGITAFFGLWQAVERSGLGLTKTSQLVRSPALVAMVVLGVPHVLIGFLFLATSRRARSLRARLHLALLVVAALALCWAYAVAKTSPLASKLPTVALALYFMVHQLRDEAFFYAVHRDGPADIGPERTRRFLAAFTWIVLVTLAGLGIFLYDVYAHGKRPARMGPLDLVLPASLGAWGRGALVAGVVAVLVGCRWWAWARAESAGMFATLRRHAPMATIYGVFLTVLLAGAFAGSVLEAVVLWHVLEWFLFGTQQAGQRERARAAAGPQFAPMGWLARAKGTRRGFLALHLGLSAAVFVVMLVWAYVHHRTGPLGAVVSPAAFYYWTICHVTVSFFPRGGPV